MVWSPLPLRERVRVRGNFAHPLPPHSHLLRTLQTMTPDEARFRSRELRRNLTDAERRLWSRLRDRAFESCKFRRQVPIGQYIVDFVSFEYRLVLELDGGQHAERKAYDDLRTKWLNEQGFHVLRFWNHEVFEDWDM